MAGLAFSEIAVHEIEITHEGAVIERRSIGRGLAAADQRAERIAAKIRELRTDGADRLGGKGADRASEAVEHADLELPPRRLRHRLVVRPGHKLREPLRLRHPDRSAA
jgi:hypothetical protein